MRIVIDNINPKLSNSLASKLRIGLLSLDSKHNLKENINQTDKALNHCLALDDLHVVLSRIDEETNVETALIKNIANTMVIGTNSPAAGAIPALENFSNKTVALENIVDRMGDILGAFFESIGESYTELAKLSRCNLTRLREAKTLVESLNTKFPIPDNVTDDIPRTESLKLLESKILCSPVGISNTLGDIIGNLNAIIENITLLSAKTDSAIPRLWSSVRTMIPARPIEKVENALTLLKQSNANLSLTVGDIWETLFANNGLKLSRSNEFTVMETDTLCDNVSIKLTIVQPKPLVGGGTINNKEYSEITRSFNIVLDRHNFVNETETQVNVFKINGITNTSLRSLISKLSLFITDLERNALWIAVNAETCAAQCSVDSKAISAYLIKVLNTSEDKNEVDITKELLQLHIGDINSVFKTISNLSTVSIGYGIEMTESLLNLLMKLPEYAPAGTYKCARSSR
jgi:hypothetical protein